MSRISAATVELLIQERNKGKSLRQLGQMYGISHEQVRQILAKNGRPRFLFLAENTVAVKLGYPVAWLIQLRKAGLIKPRKPGGHWLYSEEQVRQFPSLVAEMRRCNLCGEPRPLGYRRFCSKCSQYWKKHRYKSLNSKGEGRMCGITGGKNGGIEVKRHPVRSVG
jgi:transcriptional regulator with XRE-family HTH domain